ncbi:MAG: hypothetical protein J5486_02310 [Bacteroidaceae bacterium]|nr:hypothetical protein [Bacteroidaceae bacterium]
MDKFELQKLRDLPIEGVAERLGFQVKMHKCLCPFHDDHHASMSFSVRRNSFRCFVCGTSGGSIDLVMKYLRKDFINACRWLADEHNVILTEYKPKEDRPPKPFDAKRYERLFEHQLLNEEAKKFLFDERKIDPRVVRWCRLTSWKDKQGVPWLQTPYYDREGKLIGIQNRNLNWSKDQEPQGGHEVPRFRFPQGSECGIYNQPVLNLLKPGETLYITEGCSDCWAMLSAGHKAIAIPSATLLKHKDAELLETLNLKLGTKFGMYPDNDVPGERLFIQLKEMLPSLVRHQLPPGCKDYSDYYQSLHTP